MSIQIERMSPAELAQFRLDRHRKRAKGGYAKVTVADWERIKERFEYRCAYCHNLIGKDKVTMDHVIPLSKGGRHAVGNIVPACNRCNQHKGSLTVVEFKRRMGMSIGLHKPKPKASKGVSSQWKLHESTGLVSPTRKYKPNQSPIFGQMMREYHDSYLIKNLYLTVDVLP